MATEEANNAWNGGDINAGGNGSTHLPEVQKSRRQVEARQKYQQGHPFSGQQPSLRGLLWLHCVNAGIRLGGRPARARRCTKRLKGRFCWNWRSPGSDRCDRHRREQRDP